MSDFDLIPTWTVDEAFETFHAWRCQNADRIEGLELEEQLELYDADWHRRNN